MQDYEVDEDEEGESTNVSVHEVVSEARGRFVWRHIQLSSMVLPLFRYLVKGRNRY
jgi:hypothetical protein